MMEVRTPGRARHSNALPPSVCRIASLRFARPVQQGRRRASSAISAIKARWCIDIKYGVKMEALALVQDWIQNVGSAAGLTQENTCLSSGAVGAPESRLELEVEFETLAHVEDFWAAIPPAEHRAWSQRAQGTTSTHRVQNFIIDGSPRWELYRTCPIYAGMEGSSMAASAILKAWGSSSNPKVEKKASPEANLDDYLLKAPKPKTEDSSESPVLSTEKIDSEKPDGMREGQRMAVDWKGDPMIINPGDNMPMF